MTRPTLQIDQRCNPVQGVLTPSTVVNLTAGAASSNAALPANAWCIRLSAVNDCYIALGTAGVTATTASLFFPKGSELLGVPTGATHIACLQHTTGGVVSVALMV